MNNPYAPPKSGSWRATPDQLPERVRPENVHLHEDVIRSLHRSQIGGRASIGLGILFAIGTIYITVTFFQNWDPLGLILIIPLLAITIICIASGIGMAKGKASSAVVVIITYPFLAVLVLAIFPSFIVGIVLVFGASAVGIGYVGARRLHRG